MHQQLVSEPAKTLKNITLTPSTIEKCISCFLKVPLYNQQALPLSIYVTRIFAQQKLAVGCNEEKDEWNDLLIAKQNI